MGKGSKTCQACGISTGPRAFHCPNGHGFIVKGVKQSDLQPATQSSVEPHKRPQLKDMTVVDWQTLKPDTLIKCVSGGPVWPGKEGLPDIIMGYHGLFKVKHIDNHSIHAYPATHTNVDSGMCVIYMGSEQLTKSGLFRRPHVIKLVKQKIKQE